LVAIHSQLVLNARSHSHWEWLTCVSRSKIVVLALCPQCSLFILFSVVIHPLISEKGIYSFWRVLNCSKLQKFCCVYLRIYSRDSFATYALCLLNIFAIYALYTFVSFSLVNIMDSFIATRSKRYANVIHAKYNRNIFVINHYVQCLFTNVYMRNSFVMYPQWQWDRALNCSGTGPLQNTLLTFRSQSVYQDFTQCLCHWHCSDLYK
jgi:hypothetical protein